MKLKTLLLEYDAKVSTYSSELGNYIRLLSPKVKGWTFSIQRMTGTWEWNHPKFEDAIYATWGWEGKNEIPIETSDGESFKSIKLKLKVSEPEDEKNLKRDAKKYIDAMKKEFPKIEKKLLEY